SPFQKFHYYHPSQAGKTSIKKIFPLFSKRSYDDLAIGDGGMAMRSFVAIMSGELSEDESSRIKKDLLEYCFLDTLAMVEILEALYHIVDLHS
ncbi:MAG: DUF2779 domain-containing protein, partial [Candidatus Heimdallarchaeota archaeon]|nr:DUF2779 domain-containing protein [Candidatus Heimdallarchaeota archaeon]